MSQFTKKQLEDAADDLALCRFFPSEPGARSSVMLLLAKMCPSLEALRWLTSEMVNVVGEWQGPKELRAALCRKFTPADGVLVAPGPAQPTKEQIEAEAAAATLRYIERESAEYERKVATWKAQAALNPGEYKPFLLAAPPKRMPKARERVTIAAGPSIAELEAQLERDMAAVPTPSDEERERKARELAEAVAKRRTA